MDGFVLRIIAMVTMATDHIGWTFLPNPICLTWIGRIAFPLYAFLMAEGFLIIHSNEKRLTKHISSMILLALFSEICFDLWIFGADYKSFSSDQSVIITLFLGYLCMMLTEALIPSGTGAKERPSLYHIAVLLSGYGLAGYVNLLMHGNYNIVGPWPVIAFYWYIRCNKNSENEYTKPWYQRLPVVFLIFACYLPVYFWGLSGFGTLNDWLSAIKEYLPWIGGYCIAALIISLSNGKLGYHKKWFSRFFTLFYPVHMLILAVICFARGYGPFL